MELSSTMIGVMQKDTLKGNTHELHNSENKFMTERLVDRIAIFFPTFQLNGVELIDNVQVIIIMSREVIQFMSAKFLPCVLILQGNCRQILVTRIQLYGLEFTGP